MNNINDISTFLRPNGFHHRKPKSDLDIQNNTTSYLEKDYFSLFESTILSQTTDYPDPEPILYFVRNGETLPMLTKGSFSLWQGKQKSRTQRS